MKHIEIISKARLKGITEIILVCFLLWFDEIIFLCFPHSKDLRASSTSRSRGVRSWSPHGASQSQRRAALPPEADRSAVSSHPPAQSYRLQVDGPLRQWYTVVTPPVPNDLLFFSFYLQSDYEGTFILKNCWIFPTTTESFFFKRLCWSLKWNPQASKVIKKSKLIWKVSFHRKEPWEDAWTSK